MNPISNKEYMFDIESYIKQRSSNPGLVLLMEYETTTKIFITVLFSEAKYEVCVSRWLI